MSFDATMVADTIEVFLDFKLVEWISAASSTIISTLCVCVCVCVCVCAKLKGFQDFDFSEAIKVSAEINDRELRSSIELSLQQSCKPSVTGDLLLSPVDGYILYI